MSDEHKESSSPRGGRKHKWLRRTGWVLLGLVGVILLVVTGAWLYLQSSAGGDKVRTVALEKVNALLKGNFALRRFDLHGTTLVFEGFELRDPEGQLVAQVERLEVKPSLMQLLQRTLNVREVTLTRPRLFLVSDERGLNLARAVESKELVPPKPEEPNASPAKLRLAVGSLRLVDGQVEFRQQSEESEQRVDLEALNAEASLEYLSIGQRATAKLSLKGNVTRPVEGPLNVELSSSGDEDVRTADVALTFADAVLKAAAKLEGKDSISADVKELSVEPRTVRAFVNSYPLEQRVVLKGTGSKRGEQAKAHLELSAGKAQLELEGSADLEKLHSDGLTLKGRNIDLAELLGGKRKTNLSLELVAKGGGKSLETANGEATLHIPKSTVRGETVGPVQLHASARHGHFTVSEFNAALPGLRLNAAGDGDTRNVRLKGQLHATSLAEAAATFGGILEGGLPKLDGRGQIEFSVSGPVKGPAVVLKGGFPKLRVETLAASNLMIDVQVPDVRRPLETRAHIAASTLDLSERKLRDVLVDLQTQNRELAGTVQTKGFADASLRFKGTVDPSGQGLQLANLSLEFPEGKWSLAKPTHVAQTENGFELDPLELRQGAQAIRAEAHLRGTRVNAKAGLEKLDLGKLPKALVPPELGLAGEVTADATVTGTKARPQVVAKVALTDGAFREARGVGLTLDATYTRNVADARFQMSSPLGAARGTLLVPVEALRRHRREKISVDIALEKLSLKEATATFMPSRVLEGELTAKVNVSGTSDDPEVLVELRGKNIRYPTTPDTAAVVPTLLFRLDNNNHRRLAARFETDALGAQLWANLKTELTVAGLLDNPPNQKSIRRAPVEVELQLTKLSLEKVREAGLTETPVKGVASARAKLAGTVGDPRGEVHLQLDGFASGQLPPAEIAFHALAEGQRVTASLDARREGKQIAELNAKFAAALATLMEDLDKAASTPFEVKANFGPLDMAEVQRLTTTEPEIPVDQRLAGQLTAKLDASGTLQSPRVDFKGAADRLAVGGLPLGNGTVNAQYANAKAQVGAALRSSNQGVLNLSAKTQLDASYDSLKKGLALQQAPLDVLLTSKGFDLAFVRGFAPSIRKLKGALDANIRVDGRIGAPTFAGDVKLKGGEVALIGFGEYRNIQVDVHATDKEYAVRELSAAAGVGTIRVTAQGVRKGDAFSLKGTTESKKFPIVTDDQIVAILDHKSTLDGELSASLVNIRELYIHSARVELPDVKRKDLQELSRPSDIVLVRNGQPVEKQKKKKAPKPVASTKRGEAKTTPLVAEEPPARRYLVRIVAPRNLWIVGNDVSMDVGIADHLQLEAGETTTLFGEVRVGGRARVDVFGRRFDIQKDSFVRFSGPPAQPYINATAVYVNEKEAVTVYVTVRGQGKDITLKPTSEPPLPESEIYTLLATGRRSLKRGSGASMSASAQAATLLTSFAAQQLKKTLAAKLPLDVFSIEAGDEGLIGTKIEAGKYFTDDLYIGYTGRVGADPLKNENSNAVRLEYQIGKSWNFELEYGDAMSGAADLLWTREF